MPFDFAILGPLEIRSDGMARPVEGQRIRALLIRLLLAGNRPVSAERLIEDLWDGSPPPGARSTLPSHVSRLRRLLGPDRVPHIAGGYVLALGAGDGVDATRFEADLRQGQDAVRGGEPAVAAAAFERALGRWRGSALVDVAGSAWALSEARRLEELRLVAVESLLDAQLALGRHDDVAAAAASLVDEHPLREHLWSRLMLAQYRAGRQSDALRTYQRLRRQLAEELGIEPSVEITALEGAILRQSPALALTPPPAQAHPDTPERPPRLERVPESPPLPESERLHESPPLLELEHLGGSPPLLESEHLGGSPPLPESEREGRSELPLVGRSEQLGALLALLDRPGGAARPTLALVHGDAGCGKSRLLAELGLQARQRGALVVACSAEGDDAAPYLPLADIGRSLLAAAAPLDERARGMRADLSWLLPELGSPPLTSEADLGVARTRMFEAVLALLGAAGAGRPLLITLDDAHRLGRGTAAFFSILLRRELPRPVILVAAHRVRDAGPGDGLVELLRWEDALALEVGRLEVADLTLLVEQLHRSLDGPSQQVAVRRLGWETGGIPLLVREVLSSPTWDEVPTWDLPAGQPLPNPAVQAVLTQRTAKLSAPTQHLLQAAAILGEEFDVELLVAVARQGEDEVVDALEEAVRAGGILVEEPVADGYRWDHALIRDVFLRGGSHSRAARLHRVAAEVLAARGAFPAAARHALASAGTMPVDAAGDLARLAADAALAALDFELAKDLAGDALERLAELSPRVRGELLLRLGRAEAMRGQPAAAEDAWRRAAACAREVTDLTLLAEVALSTDLHGRYFAPSDLRWELLSEAAEALGPGWSALRMLVVSAWLTEATMPRRRAARLELATEVIYEARRLGDDAVLAAALYAGFLVTRSLSPHTDHVLAEEMAKVAERLGDPRWLFQARLTTLIGAVVSADAEQAAHQLSLLPAAAGRVGTPRAAWNCALAEATWARLHGDVGKADRLSLEAVTLGTEHGVADAELGFAVQEFVKAFHAGTLPALRPALDQYSAQYPEVAAWQMAAALGAAGEGDLVAARRGFVLALEDLGDVPSEETWLLTVCLGAELAVAVDPDPGQVSRLRSLLTPYAGQVVVIGAFVGELGPVDRYLGLLAVAGGDQPAARGYLDRAEATCRLLGASSWMDHLRRNAARLDSPPEAREA